MWKGAADLRRKAQHFVTWKFRPGKPRDGMKSRRGDTDRTECEPHESRDPLKGNEFCELMTSQTTRDALEIGSSLGREEHGRERRTQASSSTIASALRELMRSLVSEQVPCMVNDVTSSGRPEMRCAPALSTTGQTG